MPGARPGVVEPAILTRLSAATLQRACSSEIEGSSTMAVPKKRTSKMKSRSRRSANMKMTVPARSVCPNCSEAKLPHVVCPNCGWYGGRVAIEVD